MGIAILKNGNVVVALKGAVAAEMEKHIRNGYPQLVPYLPVLTAEEYPDDALPAVDPPAPPTPAEIAAAEAKANQDEVLRKIFRVAFTHENRIRVLEGKAAITAAQFRTALAVL